MAPPQYAIAHPGSESIIFAKTFSASSYSNECKSATARLKSFFTFFEQEMSNVTEPNCLSGGPHRTTSPLLRLIAIISPEDIFLFFILHDASTGKIRNNQYAFSGNFRMSEIIAIPEFTKSKRRTIFGLNSGSGGMQNLTFMIVLEGNYYIYLFRK